MYDKRLPDQFPVISPLQEDKHPPRLSDRLLFPEALEP